MDSQSQMQLNRQVLNLYKKTSRSDSTNEDSHKLHDKVFNLLFFVTSVSLRHTNMTMEIIQSSVETMETFDAMNAAKAFRHLEVLAKNLIKSPWKSGYKRIKLYSGFIKLKIEKCLKGTKPIFEALGYKKQQNEFVLVRNISSHDREMIAIDCYVASVEMEIYKDIYERVRHHGYSYLDVHKCRLHCNEDANGCEIWIMKHCLGNKNRMDSHVDNTYKTLIDKPQNAADKPQVSLNEFKPRTVNDQSGSNSKLLDQQFSNSVTSSKDQRKEKFDLSMDKTSSHFNGQIGSEQNSDVPATIDDHVKESMKLLEKEGLPKVPPPSYQSMYPSKAGNYDQEWGDVRMKIQGMGDKFSDPGGRGDILRGDNMVPVGGISPGSNRNAVPADFSLRQIDLKNGKSLTPQVHRQQNSCGISERRLFNIINDTRNTRMEVETDCDSPEYSPDAKPIQHHDVLTNIKLENTTFREQSPPFSTFGRSPNTRISPLVPEIQSMNRYSQEPTGNRSVDDGGDNDVYVSLRETTSPTLHDGKPSFQDNFQKTTQRFYQADSYQSLPHFTDRSTARSTVLNRIGKSSPVHSNKHILMRSTSEDMWQCQRCTLANEATVTVCKMCGSSREKGNDEPLKSGGNVCTKCTYVNDPGSNQCKMCKHNLKNSPTYI